MNPKNSKLYTQAMPALFVLLWATGFIGAKFGLPYAPPLKFLSLLLETRPVVWSGEFLFALGWLVLVLSLGAISLLLLLIRHGAATAVSSLMYLVPAVTALLAWLMFDETLTPLAIAGMLVAVAGVALVVRPPA